MYYYRAILLFTPSTLMLTLYHLCHPRACGFKSLIFFPLHGKDRPFLPYKTHLSWTWPQQQRAQQLNIIDTVKHEIQTGKTLLALIWWYFYVIFLVDCWQEMSQLQTTHNSSLHWGQYECSRAVETHWLYCTQAIKHLLFGIFDFWEGETSV